MTTKPQAISIGGISIGASHPPFIIAELSGNHNGSLERAIKLVEAAADAGAHAVKLQTYTADTLTIDVNSGEFIVASEDSPWAGRSLHDLYKQAHTPWDWHEPIMRRARQLGMVAFSTPFDDTAVDFLARLDVPAYKIASFENVHLPLIRKVAAQGKPVIISTGMASIGEIDDAVTTARAAGCNELVLLKCTSTYPASPENSNVATIPSLRAMFDCEIGLSDHTMGVGAPVAAVALGATVIEKHITLSRSEGGVDASFSLEPREFRSLVEEIRRAHEAIGMVRFGPTEAEQGSLVFRRSIYVVKDIAAGEKLSPENVRIIRPGYGLAPKHYEKILGATVRRDVSKGTPVSWDLLI
jgi:N-acetylneuraminate synthase